MPDPDKGFYRRYYEEQALFLNDHQSRMYFEGDPFGRYRFQQMLRIMRRMRPTSLLDVGCAEGAYLSSFASMQPNGQGVGVDIALNYLVKAKRQGPQARYVACEAERLPFLSSRFDMVICSEVLEHLVDPKAAFAELIRVSRKHVLITTPGHTLPYYVVSRIGPLRRLATAKGLLADTDPFGEFGLGGGHISIEKVKLHQLTAWARELGLKIRMAKALFSAVLPHPIPSTVSFFLTKPVDMLMNILPIPMRRGGQYMILLEREK